MKEYPAKLIYADSESCADLYYATGFFAPDPFLYLKEGGTHGESHMVVSALEIDRARRTAHVDHIHDWDDVRTSCKKDDPDKCGKITDLIASFLRSCAVGMVETPADFPLYIADQLRHRSVGVNPVEGSFWPERAIKKDDEIAAIETALEITGKGMQAGVDLLHRAEIGEDGWLYHKGEKLTSEMVRAKINSTLVKLGATPHHTIVSGGAQGADPHEEGRGPLPANQPIIMDVFPRVEKTGYWGDMTRTVCRGTAPERVKKAWEAVRQGQEIAFSMLCAGVSGKAVHEAITDYFTQEGFPTGPTEDGRQGGFFHGTGHGLGLEIHEAPRVSRVDQKLEAGHVVTVEPGLYYPDMGGVRIEDVVVIENGGCRNLTTFPKFLEV
uniref:Putative Xaa-Pro and Met-Xaa peptidase n=1 Tax=Magnetococcus massalia (strain MO-1) TaxID=451514 RepID=A0A1S7LLV1_MAGMO|nr:Putative Xaa-Pro and Met-Xaa peptidase [Candidatus Magnetococcus massalia]